MSFLSSLPEHVLFFETEEELLCPGLDSSTQDRHEPVGPGPEEGHKHSQRDGTLLWKSTETVGFVQSGEEKALKRYYCTLSTLQGGLYKKWG